MVYLRILKCATFGLCRGTLNPMTSVLTADRRKEDWDRKRMHTGGRGNLTMEACRRDSVMGQACLAPPEAWKAKQGKAHCCHQRRGCPRHPNLQFLTIPKEKNCKKQNSCLRSPYKLLVNTKIRLIIFFAAKDGEALYSQQKQDQELTVAQIMNSLLPNSDLNWRK